MLQLDGQRVSRVCFDTYGVELVTESGFELRFETRFVVRGIAGEATTVDPEAPGAASTQLLQLLQKVVDLAETAPSGALTVTFVDGSELEAPQHAEFEAWTVTGPHGERVVCLPGGGVSEWSATE